MSILKSFYPWVKLPLVVSAPMLGAATPELAVNVSRAGGFGFIAGGNDASKLENLIEQVTRLLRPQEKTSTLPIGVGFQLHDCELDPLAAVVAKYSPAVVWLFAERHAEDLKIWSDKMRSATNGKSHIWIQVGTVAEARAALSLGKPEVLILQGADAGGHGQKQSASIISLVPEVLDWMKQDGQEKIPVLAAGGIVEGRGFGAALALGASGAVLGTRFLAAEEAGIAQGWKRQIIETNDGGATTVRSTLCDRLKENWRWPAKYDGRAIRNRGHDDEESGMVEEENIRLYKEEVKQGDSAWGTHGRMVTYAGTGVGLVKKIQPAKEIVEELLAQTAHIWEFTGGRGADKYLGHYVD